MSAADGNAALILLALLAAILLLLLLRQTNQRNKLLEWLKDPAQREIPDGSGAWREVFSWLQRMRKTEQRERAVLGNHLDRFHLAAQALPDGVILLDAAYRIEWFNQAAAEHFGLDAQRDIGTLAEQLIRQREFHEMFATFRSGQAVSPQVMKAGGNDARRVLSLLLLSFADTGILLLSRDISEIVRAETMRRDFIANVSHELRTPLTVISGFLEQLTAPEAKVDSPIRGFLTLMAEQAQRMNRLVEDLLTLSRLENTIEPPRDDKVDVPELMQVLLAEAQALSSGRHVITLAQVAPVGIRGSMDEIRSAFGNLVSNAIRYTPAGGEITLSWREEGELLVFSVSDSGIGIPSEHVPRLTERFYRVDRGRSAATGGTGLGLAIVKHVLARHHGTLRIHSVIGQGSTFSACLPKERQLSL